MSKEKMNETSIELRKHLEQADRCPLTMEAIYKVMLEFGMKPMKGGVNE